MTLKTTTALVICVVASGCDALSGRCTYESRSYDGEGHAFADGSEVAAAQVSFGESRGSLSDQSFYWYITGDVKGHVLTASFKDAADQSRVLLDLPVLGADRMSIAEGVADSRDGADLTGYYSILSKSRGIVELQTDLASMSVISIPIVTTQVRDWTRPFCS